MGAIALAEYLADPRPQVRIRTSDTTVTVEFDVPGATADTIEVQTAPRADRVQLAVAAHRADGTNWRWNLALANVEHDTVTGHRPAPARSARRIPISTAQTTAAATGATQS